MAKSTVSLELFGREAELKKLQACLSANRNVILEGPVGVGKTHLAVAAAQRSKRKVFRIDGDQRYSEQKLSGWFDPPLVLKKGYTKASFIAGPLVEAMQAGAILFINELNRLPEGVQNVLLPAIDELKIQVPRLGEIIAKEGFQVIATQNPKEFVATSHLSEAILDRFDVIFLDYQTEEDERAIVSAALKATAGSSAGKAAHKLQSRLIEASVRIARLTREKKEVRRGASVRAAIGVAELTLALLDQGHDFKSAFLEAVLLALPTRVEFEREENPVAKLTEWVSEILDQTPSSAVEKKK